VQLGRITGSLNANRTDDGRLTRQGSQLVGSLKHRLLAETTAVLEPETKARTGTQFRYGRWRQGEDHRLADRTEGDARPLRHCRCRVLFPLAFIPGLEFDKGVGGILPGGKKVDPHHRGNVFYLRLGEEIIFHLLDHLQGAAGGSARR